MLPLFPLTAAHSLAEAHETARRGRSAPTSRAFQAPAPRVGWVEVRRWVSRVTPTQRRGEGQDTPFGLLAPFTRMTFHARPPPAGWVALRMRPALPTAAHRDSEA